MPSHCRVSLACPGCQDIQGDKVQRWAGNELYIECFDSGHKGSLFHFCVWGNRVWTSKKEPFFFGFLSWQSYSELKSLVMCDSMCWDLYGAPLLTVLPFSIFSCVVLSQHQTGMHWTGKGRNCWHSWKRIGTILTKWMLIVMEMLRVLQGFHLCHYCFLHGINHISLKHIIYNFPHVFF